MSGISFSKGRLCITFTARPHPSEGLDRFSLASSFVKDTIPHVRGQRLQIMSGGFPRRARKAITLPKFCSKLGALFFHSTIKVSLPGGPL